MQAFVDASICYLISCCWLLQNLMAKRWMAVEIGAVKFVAGSWKQKKHSCCITGIGWILEQAAQLIISFTRKWQCNGWILHLRAHINSTMVELTSGQHCKNVWCNWNVEDDYCVHENCCWRCLVLEHLRMIVQTSSSCVKFLRNSCEILA